MTSFRFARPALLALVVGAAFSAGFCLRAQGQDDISFDVINYRTAMNQLRAGRPQNAQILLEIERDKSPSSLPNETALLLAYLQDENGQGAEARKTLSALAAPSPLANAYLRRLGVTALQPQPRVVQPFSPQPLATGPNSQAARLGASDARLTKLEAYMVDLVNDAREQEGLPRLQNDPQLAEVARAHSAEMRDKAYFEHESPTRWLKDPLDRYMAAFGAKPHVIAENIYRVWGGRSYLTQEEVLVGHNKLMASPHHRPNIMDRRVTRLGIGFCTNATGDLWMTQMFSHPF